MSLILTSLQLLVVSDLDIVGSMAHLTDADAENLQDIKPEHGKKNVQDMKPRSSTYTHSGHPVLDETHLEERAADNRSTRKQASPPVSKAGPSESLV